MGFFNFLKIKLCKKVCDHHSQVKKKKSSRSRKLTFTLRAPKPYVGTGQTKSEKLV